MRDADSNFDLAIIGGGPAGTSAAVIAARLGVRVALLEAGNFPRQKVCGEFVSAESLELLCDLLARCPEAERAIERAPLINCVRLFLWKQIVQSSFAPAARSIPRFELDRLLWSAAREAGAHTLENSEVRKIEGEGPFDVQTTTGKVRANTIIVAAGRWSRFRPAVQIPEGPKWVGVKAHFRERNPAQSTDLYFFDHGYCGVQPVADTVVNACAMVRSDRATTLDGVLSLHPALSQRSQSWALESEPVATAPLIFRTPTPTRGNIIFVGDAAAFIDPFVGDGISLALRTGVAAAQEVGRVVHCECSLDEAVASYDRQYQQEFAPLVRSAARIRSVLSSPKPVLLASMQFLRLPGVLPYLIRKTRRAD